MIPDRSLALGSFPLDQGRNAHTGQFAELGLCELQALEQGLDALGSDPE